MTYYAIARRESLYAFRQREHAVRQMRHCRRVCPNGDFMLMKVTENEEIIIDYGDDPTKLEQTRDFKIELGERIRKFTKHRYMKIEVDNGEEGGFKVEISDGINQEKGFGTYLIDAITMAENKLEQLRENVPVIETVQIPKKDLPPPPEKKKLNISGLSLKKK